MVRGDARRISAIARLERPWTASKVTSRSARDNPARAALAVRDMIKADAA